MKSCKRYFLTGIFFLFHLSVDGQFNTLTPTTPMKKENPAVLEKMDEPKASKQQTDKNFWKAIFNTTSKADLKKELDSLKTMIKESSAANIKKWNMKKVKDSLILLHSQQPINVQKINVPIDERSFANKTGHLKVSKIAMPLNNAFSVSSPYGTRIHPITGIVRLHSGIDLKAYYENVYAVMDGIVTANGWDPKGGGNYIKVKHSNIFETAYLHLSGIYYKVGDFVRAGFIIAKSGNTGSSTGPHLHFAVKERGKYINPIHFLNDLIKADHLLTASDQNERNSYLQQ